MHAQSPLEVPAVNRPCVDDTTYILQLKVFQIAHVTSVCRSASRTDFRELAGLRDQGPWVLLFLQRRFLQQPRTHARIRHFVSTHAVIHMVGGHALPTADQLAAAAPRKAQRLPLNPLHAHEHSRSMAGRASAPPLTCQLCSDPIDTEEDEHIEVLTAPCCI